MKYSLMQRILAVMAETNGLVSMMTTASLGAVA